MWWLDFRRFRRRNKRLPLLDFLCFILGEWDSILRDFGFCFYENVIIKIGERHSYVLLFVLDDCVIRPGLRSHRRWPDRSIRPPRPNHKLLLTKFSPVGDSFFSRPLPFFFSQNFELFHHSLGLEFFNILLIFRLLHLDEMVLLIIEVLEYFRTHLLEKLWKGGVIQGHLPILLPSLILLLPLKNGPFPSFPHNPQINLLLLGI